MMMKWGRGQGFARPTNYSQYEVWRFKGNLDTIDYRHKPGNWFEMKYVLYDNPDLEGTEWYLKPLRLYKDPTLPLPERMSFDNVLCDDTIRNWFGYPIYKFWVYDNDRPERQDGGQADMIVMLNVTFRRIVILKTTVFQFVNYFRPFGLRAFVQNESKNDF